MGTSLRVSTCVRCGAIFENGSRGRLARTCSASCHGGAGASARWAAEFIEGRAERARAMAAARWSKAGAREAALAKWDGRRRSDLGWYRWTTPATHGPPGPCRYCGEFLTSMKSKARVCQHAECRRQLTNYQQRQFLARRAATDGGRYEDRYKVTKVCPGCSATFHTRHGSTWCKSCAGRMTIGERNATRQARNAERRALLLPVPLFGPPSPFCGQASDLPARHPARRDWSKSTGLLFVYGPCRRCGEPFMVGVGNAAELASYCSRSCSRADSKDRRRAKERAAAGGPVRRWEIFERDGWRCQLCGRKVDRSKAPPHPKAPTLDHILPIDALGRHDPANVQCAHFICNSLKGNRVWGAGEQLRLVG